MLARLRKTNISEYLIWFLIYFALSLIIYHGIVLNGLGYSIPNNAWGNGDWGLSSFMMAWTPYSIIHHVNPFYSNNEFALHGINMMATPAYFTQAFIMSPVTELFGTIVSLNLAIILAPIVCALPAAIVFYKITSYKFGSVVGGLFAGFGRGLISGNVSAHLNLSWIFAPPIIIYIFYNILRKKDADLIKSGVALGIVMTLQFYASTEVLVDTLYVCLAAGVVVLFVNARIIKERFFKLLGTLFIGGFISGVACIYAVYVFLYGHAHVFVERQMWDSVLNYNLLFVFFPRNVAHNGIQIFGDRFCAITLPVFAVAILIVRINKTIKDQTAKVAFFMFIILFLVMFGPLLQGWAQGPLQPNPVYYVVRHLPFVYAVLYRRFVYYDELFLGLSIVYVLKSFKMNKHSKANFTSRWFNARIVVTAFILLNLLWNSAYVWNVQTSFQPNPVLSSKTYLPENGIIWVYPRISFNSGLSAAYLAQSGLRYKVVSVYANLIFDGQNSIMLPPSALRSYIDASTKPGVLPQADIINNVKGYVASSKISCIVIYNASQYKSRVNKVSYIYGSPKIIQNTDVWCHLKGN